MMTYPKYRALVATLVEEGKSTGATQSEALTQYSLLNNKRMQRLYKKGILSDSVIEKVRSYNKPVEWIVLTESWCGDAAQVLPYVNKIALKKAEK